MRHETTDLAIYRRVVGLLALADGVLVTRRAEWLGVTRQSLYNWSERYFEEGRPSALQGLPHPGRPPLWDEDCAVPLRTSLRQSPGNFDYPAVNWTVGLLQDQMRRCLGREFSEVTIRRRLHQLGYEWKRPRYVLKPDPEREKKEASLAPLVLEIA